jgi:oligoribonuclease NrnB/cAMP/cGMP phosphodiesterase (DHH superfamily)
MTYDAYFHNDIDGRASIAILLDFFESRGDTIGEFVPVDYSIEPKWPTLAFKHPPVIADFLYHPRSAWWFDHHRTTFLKPAWEKRFKPDERHVLDQKYPSACHLVRDSLVKHFGYKPPRHIKELVKWVDIIDAANFKSARQTIEKKEPALQLESVIDHRKGDRPFAERLIRLFAAKPLRSIVADPEIKRWVAAGRREREELLRFYAKRLQIEGSVAWIDLVPLHGQELRFAPYYLAPDILYVVGLKPLGAKRYHVNISINPWRRRENKIHLGEFLHDAYKGGGHHDVGGAELRGTKGSDEILRGVVARFQKALKK